MLLKFAVKDFLDDRELSGASPRTISAYRYTLEQFMDFCAQKEVVTTTDITSSIVKEYILHCKNDLNNKPSSLNHKLRNLKTFFNYLEEIEDIAPKKNPMQKINYIKDDVKIEVFTDEQVRQMLVYFRRIKQKDKTFAAYRDYTIVVFLLGTGVRAGELVSLTWDDVDFENEQIYVLGKSRKKQSIPITDKLKKELAEYRIFVQKHFNPLPEFVFPAVNGKQLTTNGLRQIFKRLSKTMGFKNVRVSAHTFRHTFAHRALMAGMDVFTLQKILRHARLDMTQRYLALWGTDLKERADKYNPLNNIDI